VTDDEGEFQILLAEGALASCIDDDATVLGGHDGRRGSVVVDWELSCSSQNTPDTISVPHISLR